MAQTAAVMGLNATGPQDKYLFDEDAKTWRPNVRQYTHFTKFHRTTYPQVNKFVGQTVEFTFKPKELGDLWHNAYLALTLPQLPSSYGGSDGNFSLYTITGDGTTSTAVTLAEHTLVTGQTVTISGGYISTGAQSWALSPYSGQTVVVTVVNATTFTFSSSIATSVATGGYITIKKQNYSLCPQIGRALIEHIEFRIGQEIIEKIDDNWYIIRDQLFLDADEKLAMYKATNGGLNETQSCPTTQSIDLMIPLELFFCRRHSFVDPNRELIETPPLPVCALKENISIKFFFRPQGWFTDYPNPIEFSNVRMITEEIILTDEERLYYQTKPQRFVINQAWSNPTITYSNGTATQNFTANFPITMMCWFIRNKGYEVASSNVTQRFNFGYYSPYATAANSLVYFNGATVGYIDTISTCQIFLNGRDVTGTFGTGPFFQYKQPMDHELTTPLNSIYTYCFGKTPKYYNQGGYMNFENIDSQASKININFKPEYIKDIGASYNFYIYYYGYQVLTVSNGRVILFYK